MKLFVLIVIYNEYCEKCSAMRSLMKINDVSEVSIVICDNSDNAQYKSENIKTSGIYYVDMNGNKGIANAYARALDEIPFSENNWILTSDQDTTYPEGFIENLLEMIKKNPQYNVFAPVVRNGDSLVSPCTINKLRFECVEANSFNANVENRVFINSGLCYRADLLKKCSYDKNLFLDFVDYDFIFQLRKTDIYNPYVLENITVQQNFSGQTANSKSVDLARYTLYVKDGSYFYEKWYSKHVFNWRVLLLRALKLTLTHKDIGFLKVFLKTI